MKPSLLIIIVIVSAGAIASVTIGTIEYQSIYNYNCNSDGGNVTGFLRCAYVNVDFSDPRITGKMAREICSVTGGECPPNYPANVLDDGTKMVGVTIWNAETNSEKSYVFTITNNTLSYKLNQSAFDLSKISSMRPDSVEFFYYPHPEDTENRDAFERYMIIRLPVWLGGNATDASAYRIFSAKSTDDSCLVRYWPGEERQRIENPCKGGFYRIYDGVFTLGFGSVPNTNPVALPYLEVSADKNGFLFVEPPTFSKDKNGVIGYGRQVSMQEIADGSQFYIDSFAKYYPDYPPIRKNFAGLMLAEIVQVYHGAKIRYTDFQSVTNLVEMIIQKCGCSNLYATYSYETLEEINGVTVAVHDTISQHPQVNESVNKHYFRFAHDGFKYEISGKDYDSIRQSIISLLTNYNIPITPEVGKTG